MELNRSKLFVKGLLYLGEGDSPLGCDSLFCLRAFIHSGACAVRYAKFTLTEF